MQLKSDLAALSSKVTRLEQLLECMDQQNAALIEVVKCLSKPAAAPEQPAQGVQGTKEEQGYPLRQTEGIRGSSATSPSSPSSGAVVEDAAADGVS